MGWECFCVVGFDLGPLLQGGMRILHLQYFFKYVLTYFLHLNSYLVTLFHNTICREQLFCPFLLSASEFLSNMLFYYHLLFFCTALSLIIMLSSHYHLHKSKTLSQLTQCPFTGTLLVSNHEQYSLQYVCIWEEFSRKGPPAPQVCLPIASSVDDLKKLDDKLGERFSRLEAMLLAKCFTVPVEPVVKPAAEVTSQKPFLCCHSAAWAYT